MADISEASTPAPEKRCIACCQAIQFDATICPHCRTSQKSQRWKLVATTLKWIGATTAIISLVIGLVRVNELFIDWRHRTETVSELVSAAELQRKNGFYKGAWDLIQLALELKPGSPKGRRQQIIIAKEWLRNIRITGDEAFTNIVERLLPALSRGVVAAESASEAADFLAHIGWAHYLLHREGRFGTDIDAIFKAALERDPGNVYAHVMWGFWVLWPYNRKAYESDKWELAKRHFALARKTERDQEYVIGLQFSALKNTNTYVAKAEIIQLANNIREQNRDISDGLKKKIQQAIERPPSKMSYGEPSEDK